MLTGCACANVLLTGYIMLTGYFWIYEYADVYFNEYNRSSKAGYEFMTGCDF